MIPAKTGGKKAMSEERMGLTQQCGEGSPLWQLCIRPGEQRSTREKALGGRLWVKWSFHATFSLRSRKNLSILLIVY